MASLINNLVEQMLEKLTPAKAPYESMATFMWTRTQNWWWCQKKTWTTCWRRWSGLEPLCNRFQAETTMKAGSLVGVVVVVFGTVFLDLATLVFKNDLYLLTLLGTFNNWFSLSVWFAGLQAIISLALVVLGVKIIQWQR